MPGWKVHIWGNNKNRKEIAEKVGDKDSGVLAGVQVKEKLDAGNIKNGKSE